MASRVQGGAAARPWWHNPDLDMPVEGESSISIDNKRTSRYCNILPRSHTKTCENSKAKGEREEERSEEESEKSPQKGAWRRIRFLI